jgi:hypothetical protein
MSEDFRAGCWAKIDRANEHIQHLKAEFDKFLLGEPKPFSVVRDAKKDGQGFEWLGFEERAPPLRFSIIAGEAIHQLRSSLDHRVVAMVRKRRNSVTTRHAFPITRKPKEFKSAIDRGQIKGISRDAHNLIERKQPFNSGNVDTSVLAALHSQDIEDKHRLLMVVTAGLFLSHLHLKGPITLTAPKGDPAYVVGPRFGFRRVTKDGVQLHAKWAQREVGT